MHVAVDAPARVPAGNAILARRRPDGDDIRAVIAQQLRHVDLESQITDRRPAGLDAIDPDVAPGDDALEV